MIEQLLSYSVISIGSTYCLYYLLKYRFYKLGCYDTNKVNDALQSIYLSKNKQYYPKLGDK